MPPVVQGSVHWYDYGPIVGNELSGRRPALVISTSRLNHNSTIPVVLTLPVSSSEPSPRHLRNPVFVESIGSWASVRQIKSAEKSRLGDKLGDASPQEMERVLEIFVARLASTGNRPSTINTPFGPELVRPGTIWSVDFRDLDGAIRDTHILILDLNAGNGMAIAVEVGYTRRANSPVRIPVSAIEPAGQAFALIHRVRSIDVNARTLSRVNAIDEASLLTVKSELRSAIDR